MVSFRQNISTLGVFALVAFLMLVSLAVAQDNPLALDGDVPVLFADYSVNATPASQTTVVDPGCTCGQCKPSAQGKPAGGCKTCCHGFLVDWSKYPETIRPMPRPGIFPIPATAGPAYFSLWDELTGECREAPPKSGYAPFALNAWPFFDADWRFVESIDPADRTFVESLKRMHLNDCLMFSTGGEFWLQHHNEHNSRLTETNNDYTLSHVRLFGDLSYSNLIRVYGEYVWADSFGETLPPLPPDVDRGDILDLFVDVNLFEYEGKPVYLRGGRQELLYGSQRMVTPLPWANKRHSFDGVKLMRRGEKWDFDAFWRSSSLRRQVNLIDRTRIRISPVPG